MNTYFTRLARTFAVSSLMMTLTVMVPALANPQTTPAVSSLTNINWNKVGLSPKQAETIRTLRDKFNLRATRLKGEIKQKQAIIQQLLLSPAGNPDLIRKLMADKLLLENALQNEALENYLAIKKELTPTQIVGIYEQLRAVK